MIQIQYEKACTSKEVENEDEAVRLGEDGVNLQAWFEKVEVCLRDDGPICSRVESGSIRRGWLHTCVPRSPAVYSDVIHHDQSAGAVWEYKRVGGEAGEQR